MSDGWGGSEMRGFLWRAWFFTELGASLVGAVTVICFGLTSKILMGYLIFMAVGVAQGLFRVMVLRQNPFRFWPEMR